MFRYIYLPKKGCSDDDVREYKIMLTHKCTVGNRERAKYVILQCNNKQQ